MVTWLTLFWWQYAGNELPGRSVWLLDDLTLDDHDPVSFHLFVRSHNIDRSVISSCNLTLTLDEKLGSYVYRVTANLEVLPGKVWIVEPQGGVEFANPWYKDAVGSAVTYEGAVPPRWDWVAYTNPHNEIVRLPLNHLGSPWLERIHFPASGGWLAFLNHEDGNPIIELDAETAVATRAEVCAWGYDVHFIYRIPPGHRWKEQPVNQNQVYEPVVLSGGQQLTASYRLFSLSSIDGNRILDRAIARDLPADVAERLARPAFSLPVCDFQASVDPSRPDSAWYWSPSHPDGVTWDKTLGRSDNASLHVDNSTNRLAYWEVPIGPDFWMGPLLVKRQLVQVWIRTVKAAGAGAYVTFRYSNYPMETDQQPRLPEFSSRRLREDSGWQLVDLIVDPPPPGATRAYLRLVLEGPGEAWFDDLVFKPID